MFGKKKYLELVKDIERLNDKIDQMVQVQLTDEAKIFDIKEECQKMYFNLEKLIESKTKE